jgi:hypothetical protein
VKIALNMGVILHRLPRQLPNVLIEGRVPEVPCAGESRRRKRRGANLTVLQRRSHAESHRGPSRITSSGSSTFHRHAHHPPLCVKQCNGDRCSSDRSSEAEPLPPPPPLWAPILLPDPLPPYRIMGHRSAERRVSKSSDAPSPRINSDSHTGETARCDTEGEALPDLRHYFAVTRHNFTELSPTMRRRSLEIIGAPMSGLCNDFLSVQYLERYFEAVRKYKSHCIFVERDINRPRNHQHLSDVGSK